jgi:N utilization substance protein A
LAIGRRGQNARLAAKLVGWKVDIKSRGELAREAEQKAVQARATLDELAAVPGIGPSIAGRLLDAGFTTLEKVMRVSADDLMAVKGVGPRTAAKILAAVQDVLSRPAREEDAGETREIPPAEELAGEAIGDGEGVVAEDVPEPEVPAEPEIA